METDKEEKHILFVTWKVAKLYFCKNLSKMWTFETISVNDCKWALEQVHSSYFECNPTC